MVMLMAMNFMMKFGYEVWLMVGELPGLG